MNIQLLSEASPENLGKVKYTPKELEARFEERFLKTASWSGHVHYRHDEINCGDTTYLDNENAMAYKNGSLSRKRRTSSIDASTMGASTMGASTMDASTIGVSFIDDKSSESEFFNVEMSDVGLIGESEQESEQETEQETEQKTEQKTAGDTGYHFVYVSDSNSTDNTGCTVASTLRSEQLSPKSRKTFRKRKKLVTGAHINNYKCTICNKSFSFDSHLKIHLMSHSDVRLIKCEVPGCTYTCKSKDNLISHMRYHSKGKKFKCQELRCEFETKYYSNLVAHNKTCNKDANANVKCDMCNKHFCKMIDYNKHLKVHNINNPHVCHLCGYRFLYKQSLVCHLNSKHNVGDFVCPLCKKVYSTDQTLKGHKCKALLPCHRKSITDKFMCKLCGKRYSTKYKLKKHPCKPPILTNQ